jgi:hypothetical protein
MRNIISSELCQRALAPFLVALIARDAAVDAEP